MELLITLIGVGAGLLVLLIIYLAIFSPEILVNAAEFVAECVVRLLFGKSVDSFQQKMRSIPVGPVVRFIGFLLIIGFFLWLYRFQSTGLD